MLRRTDIEVLQSYENAKEIFPSVEIKGGVSFFLRRDSYKGDCLFNGAKVNLSARDILVVPQYDDLIAKIEQHSKKNPLSSIFIGRGRIETNDSRLVDEPTSSTVRCWVSTLKKKDRIRYIEKGSLTEKGEPSYKVITARASGKGRSGFGFTIVINPEDVYTGSYLGFKVKTREEGESLISYMSCPIVNELLASRKITQDISSKVLEWIPLPPLDRTWTNDQIKEYYKLTGSDDSRSFD